MLAASPLKRTSALLITAAWLTGCDTLGSLLGTEEADDPPLPGERIAVMDYQSELKADILLTNQPLSLPKAIANQRYIHDAYLQQQGIGNIRLEGFEVSQTAEAGDGNEWELGLIQHPIIADGLVLVKDAADIVSAHREGNIEEPLWTAETALTDADESIPGGGLSYAGGVVYVTSGAGSITALVAKDGSLLWRKELETPIRSAPAIADGKLFVISIDNQLVCLSARTGKLLWTHRGIKESAVYLGTVVPVIQNGIVLAAYSSGELFALRSEDGSPLWMDSLITAARTRASAILTGIGATPVISGNIVYAVSNSGLLIANLLSNGRGVWDMEIGSYHTPWLAEDYLFLLSDENRLMAIERRSRRIRWITELNSFLPDTEQTVRLSAPVMVNDKLMIITPQGEALLFSPEDGTLVRRLEIPEDVSATPAFANGRMYLLDRNANLFQF